MAQRFFSSSIPCLDTGSAGSQAAARQTRRISAASISAAAMKVRMPTLRCSSWLPGTAQSRRIGWVGSVCVHGHMGMPSCTYHARVLVCVRFVLGVRHGHPQASYLPLHYGAHNAPSAPVSWLLPSTAAVARRERPAGVEPWTCTGCGCCAACSALVGPLNTGG
jgi:hypothetical protein